MTHHPLIIAGSGRSGTTWVLDVLAEANNLRPVFEPLNPFGVSEARPFCNRYLRENDYEPELKCFMEKIFNGKLNHIWPNTRFLPSLLRPSISKMSSWNYNYTLLSRYKNFLIQYYYYVRKKSFRPITKFIRANLMLDWIERNFGAKIVYIVRHPGAVVASKITASKTEGGAIWDFTGPNEQRILSQYKHDEQLRTDYLDKYYEIFSEKLSPVSGHTLLWCIENMLPVYTLQKKKQYVFFYEDVLNNPEIEFDRMVKILGVECKPDNSIIALPSQQASREMKNGTFEGNQLTRWMKKFNRQELDEIDGILKFFKVTIYNAFEPLPVNRTQECI
jgi:hypothetical protein